ncbi:MAG TPA: DsbA family protein [Chitinivibrionales bacterium]|nr:DsbA family protein [Chitinivibrionales bacterium]
MIPAEANKPEIFSKKFLAVLLVISILTNVVLVLQQRDPYFFTGIRYAFLPVPKVLPADHVRGNPNAKNTVIEYADFQCPFCAEFHQSMNTVMKEADVRWVYRHFPLKSHSLAPKAAEASECAADQKKFWEYSDALFNTKTELTDETFIFAAGQIGLDVPAFEKCLSNGTHRAVVDAHLKDGKKMKVDGTPTLFINGKRYDGYVPLDALRKLIKIK